MISSSIEQGMGLLVGMQELPAALAGKSRQEHVLLSDVDLKLSHPEHDRNTGLHASLTVEDRKVKSCNIVSNPEQSVFSCVALV